MTVDIRPHPDSRASVSRETAPDHVVRPPAFRRLREPRGQDSSERGIVKNNQLPLLVIVCAVLTFLIGSVTLYYVESRFVAAAGENLALAAVDIAGKLDLLMAERYGDIQMMARSKTFQEGDAAAMTRYLEWMISAYPVYEWLGVTDASGRPAASTDPAGAGGDGGGFSRLQTAQDRVAVQVRDVASLSGGTRSVMAVVFTAPIRGARNEFLGTVVSRVALPALEDAFVQTVTALQAQWGTDVRIEYQFVGHEGDVITDSHLREEGRVNLRRMGLPSARLFDAAPPGFVEERHLRRQVDVVTGYALTKGVEGVSALRWGVLVRVDRSDILAPVRTIVWKVGAAGVGMLLPLVGVLLWSLNRMGRARTAASEEHTRAKTAERKFQELVQSAPDAIVVADQSGLIVSWNAVAAKLFGYTEREALGQPLTVLIPSRYRDAHTEGIRRLQSGGRPRLIGTVVQLEALRKNGTEFPIELSLGTWQTSSGSYYSGIIRDISERKRAEKELLLAKDAAEAGTRTKSEFLATMSHEIRTPMNGVIGMTGLLLDTALTAEQREYAEMVRASGEALLDIINDILDFSKIEAGKLDLETIDFDLRAMVEDVVLLLAERAHSKGLELACLIHAAVPTALRGDPGRLRQILTNLVGNAIKFTEAGEIVVSVSVADSMRDCAANEVGIRFEVVDTGVGVTEDQRARLFRPFTQADSSTTRKFGGTGLGLAICKQLTRLMEGQIGVESIAGKGSTFWLTVRLARQEETFPEAPIPAAPLSGRKVLIVDDHATNRRVLEHQLGLQGLLHESAESGRQALDLLRVAARDVPFDLAILDMQMPGMDGLELARLINADPTIRSVRLVLLTSLGRRGDAKAAQEAGIAAYLTKPVRQGQLIDCLRRLLPRPGQPKLVSVNQPDLFITRHSLAEARAYGRNRVLVVEDNPINQKVAVKMLEKLGCRVDVAANGREAIEGLARIPYAMVLMDCLMPEMDGFEATRFIRKQEGTGYRVPVIAMTANVMEGDRERCLAAGMDDYIAKPITSKDLAAILGGWLKSSNPTGSAER